MYDAVVDRFAATAAAPTKTTGINRIYRDVRPFGMTKRNTPASLEISVAKGQKRSNREIKKPKKAAAERARTAAERTNVAAGPVVGSFGKSARDGQTRR